MAIYMDIVFRVLCVLVFLPAILVRLYFYYRTKEFIKKPTKIEGVMLNVLMKATLAIGQLFALLYIIGASWIFQFRLEFPIILRIFGVLILAFSSYLLVWIHLTLGSNFSRTLKIKNKHTLVTNGPYFRVRHPMYSAFITMWLGIFLLSSNYLIGLSALAYLSVVLFRIPKEERMLQEHFQIEYERYMKRTGKLIPRIGKMV